MHILIGVLITVLVLVSGAAIYYTYRVNKELADYVDSKLEQ